MDTNNNQNIYAAQPQTETYQQQYAAQPQANAYQQQYAAQPQVNAAPPQVALVAKKKKPPIWLFIVIGVVVMAAAVGGAFFAMVYANEDNRMQRKLNAAEKYLDEMEYEKAIATYKEAISINSTSVDAYMGLASVYVAMADEAMDNVEKFSKKGKMDKAQDAYDEAMEYYEMAKDVMEDALDNVGDDDIKAAEKYSNKIDGYIEDAQEDWEEISEGEDPQGIIDPWGDIAPDDFTTTTTVEEPPVSYFSDVSIGEHIYFGSYEQDNIYENGMEPIEWRVLDINENGIMLISEYLLDCKMYNDILEDVTWETCSLRQWLNNDFYYTAFNEDEQNQINLTYVVNNDNYFTGAYGGNDTYDYVYLLNNDEVAQYFGYNYYDSYEEAGHSQYLIAQPTPYAISRGVNSYFMLENDYYEFEMYGYSADLIGVEDAWWWLRSPGYDNTAACDSFRFGTSGRGISYHVTSDFSGIRPVIYVKY